MYSIETEFPTETGRFLRPDSLVDNLCWCCFTWL